MIPVTERKIEELNRRMQELGVSENDIEESFVRASGPGGQHTNKASTAVILIHKPSGIRVKCGIERSQAVNRFLARRRLLELIELKRTGKIAKEKAERERIRRQKRRRSRRAKEKMLDSKSKRAELKRQRMKINIERE